MSGIYDFSLNDAYGVPVPLSEYRGKVLLIVNTATQCGLTPQYEALVALHERYQAQGFEVLDIPCNQFRAQAPESAAEIAQSCQMRFGVKFRTFDKIDVNGEHAHPLYVYLKSVQPKDLSGSHVKAFLLKLASLGEKRAAGDIQWNFSKFLVAKDGQVTARFAPSEDPAAIAPYIEALLAS